MAILITHTNLAGILYISLFIIAITILFSVRLNDDWIRNQIRNSRGEKILIQSVEQVKTEKLKKN